MFLLYIAQCMSMVVTIRAQMEGFIVGGAYTVINRYPHSAFLSIKCVIADGSRPTWVCGSSLLNQRILLTAGHCVYTCHSGTQIMANMGDEHREYGIARTANGFLVHEDYRHELSHCDIGLIKLVRPVTFNSRIKRVAIMRRPPYRELANVAGWGQINENTKAQGLKLKHINQIVWENKDCEKMFYHLPPGTFCASSDKLNDFAAPGDSGSALVVRGYIQIGLVSFKNPATSRSLIVYTDVGYYYDWIQYNAKRLYCSRNASI